MGRRSGGQEDESVGVAAVVVVLWVCRKLQQPFADATDHVLEKLLPVCRPVLVRGGMQLCGVTTVVAAVTPAAILLHHLFGCRLPLGAARANEGDLPR